MMIIITTLRADGCKHYPPGGRKQEAVSGLGIPWSAAVARARRPGIRVSDGNGQNSVQKWFLHEILQNSLEFLKALAKIQEGNPKSSGFYISLISFLLESKKDSGSGQLGWGVPWAPPQKRANPSPLIPVIQ